MNTDRIENLSLRIGAQFTRYSIVALLLLFGAMKWTAAEAQGIQPLVAHSPFWGWLYGPLGVQGVSIFFGIFEIAAALAIASRPWFPRLSAAGSALHARIANSAGASAPSTLGIGCVGGASAGFPPSVKGTEQ